VPDAIVILLVFFFRPLVLFGFEEGTNDFAGRLL
jgi:hypothetical protein